MSSPQERGFRRHLCSDELPLIQFMPIPDFRPKIAEEQLQFFHRIIGACMSRSPESRQRGHQLLAGDSRVKDVMSLLAQFIYKTMCVNIAEENLKFLVFIMRMISALLANSALNLDKYIHLLVPGPLGTLLADQISCNPAAEDHWAVRMYANIIVSDIVKRYNCTMSTIIDCYNESLLAESLESVYGAVIGLGKLGEPTIRQYLLPKLQYIAGRIEPHLRADMEMSSVSLKTLAAKYISEALVEICGPVLKEPQDMQSLTADFGLLKLTEESVPENNT